MVEGIINYYFKTLITFCLHNGSDMQIDRATAQMVCCCYQPDKQKQVIR